MIVSLHVATGAAAGALTRSRLAAALLGPVLHAAGDAIPHHDIPSRRFEVASGVACVLAVAMRHGPTSPETIGALAASAPDLEHVLPRLGERDLFPSHRFRGWHREGGVPAWAQLVAAGTILGAGTQTRMTANRFRSTGRPDGSNAACVPRCSTREPSHVSAR